MQKPFIGDCRISKKTRSSSNEYKSLKVRFDFIDLPLPGSADFDRVRDGERARRCISSNS